VAFPAPRHAVLTGAPGAGKTTLGAALARRLGCGAFSMDDLYVAAKALTTPQSHPGLHCMRRLPSAEYFTETEPAALIADAVAQHAALLPAIEAVVRYRAVNGPPAVIDGWFVTPEDVQRWDLPSVRAVWLVTSEAVLVARERAFAGFYAGSAAPERMLRHFVARSLWHDARIREQAGRLGLPLLEHDGRESPDELATRALAQWPGDARAGAVAGAAGAA